MSNPADKLVQALLETIAALDSVALPGSLQLTAMLNANAALSEYNAARALPPRLGCLYEDPEGDGADPNDCTDLCMDSNSTAWIRNQSLLLHVYANPEGGFMAEVLPVGNVISTPLAHFDINGIQPTHGSSPHLPQAP